MGRGPHSPFRDDSRLPRPMTSGRVGPLPPGGTGVLLAAARVFYWANLPKSIVQE